jgi:hypothetical protein
MPWKRAKALPPPDNTLFEACFRIQREASAAAGHLVPLVVENVCGAQKWVGRARWHFGSFYLWGDVPALMPLARGVKQPGLAGLRTNGKGDGWFQDGAAQHWSNSPARKAASAHIAKIPINLARHIAQAWHP